MIKGKRNLRPGSDKISAPATAALPWERWETGCLLGLTALALALRLWRVATASLWIDELGTIHDARSIFGPEFWRQSHPLSFLFGSRLTIPLPTAAFWNRTHFLAFILARISLMLGENEFTLRLPTLLFGTLAVPMIYLAARRWLRSPQAACIAALVTALSLYQLYFSREARYYTIVTFLSALSLFLLRGLTVRPRLASVALFVAVHLCNYGVHPTTFVLFGSQSAYLVFHWSRHGGLRHIRDAWRPHQGRIMARVIHVALLVAALAFLAVAYRPFLSVYFRQIVGRLAQFPHLDFTFGVGWTPQFFLSPIFKFAILNGSVTGPGTAAGHLYCLVFGFGLAWAFRQRRDFAVLCLISYGALYAALFLLKFEAPYTDKYAIFLYPFFAACVGAGLWGAAQGISRRVPDSKRMRVSIALAVAATLLLQGLQASEYQLFLMNDVQSYRMALAHVRKNWHEGDRIGVSPFAGPGVHYYAPKFGFETGQLESFAYDAWDALRLLRKGQGLWLLPVLPYGHPRAEEELGLVKTMFETKAVFPSVSGAMYDIPVLYRSGRNLIWPARQFAFAVAPRKGDGSNPGQGRGSLPLDESSPGIWSGAEPLCFLDEGHWGVVLEGAPGNSSAATFAGLGFERIDVGLRRQEGRWVSDPFAVKRGDSRLELALQAPDLPASSSMRLTLLPLDNHVPGIFADRTSELGEYTALPWKGHPVLALLRDGGAIYRIATNRAGLHQCQLRAVADRPRPVFGEIVVNGNSQGVLVFDKQNDEYQDRAFVADLKRGENEIGVYFLNDGPSIENPVDLTPQGSDLLIGALAWTPVEKGQPAMSEMLPHDWFWRDMASMGNILFCGKDKPDALGPFWAKEGEGTVAVVGEGRVVEIAMEPGSKGLSLGTPPLPVPSEILVFCCAQVRCAGLFNHSANIIYVYLDERKQLLDYQFGQPVGATGDTDWIRLPTMRISPKGTRYISIQLSLYPNGVMAGTKPGKASFKDFHFLPQPPRESGAASAPASAPAVQ